MVLSSMELHQDSVSSHPSSSDESESSLPLSAQQELSPASSPQQPLSPPSSQQACPSLPSSPQSRRRSPSPPSSLVRSPSSQSSGSVPSSPQRPPSPQSSEGKASASPLSSPVSFKRPPTSPLSSPHPHQQPASPPSSPETPEKHVSKRRRWEVLAHRSDIYCQHADIAVETGSLHEESREPINPCDQPELQHFNPNVPMGGDDESMNISDYASEQEIVPEANVSIVDEASDDSPHHHLHFSDSESHDSSNVNVSDESDASSVSSSPQKSDDSYLSLSVCSDDERVVTDVSSEEEDEECASESGDSDECTDSVKLFHGSNHTVDEVVLEILENYLKNKETQRSLKDHLSTLIRYLPQPNFLPRTHYQLVKYVSDLAPTYVETEYLYCSNCLLLLPANTEKNEMHSCGSAKKKKFYGFSIAEQLRYYFEEFKIYELFKLNYEKKNDNVISDICDGSEYLRVHTEISAQIKPNSFFNLYRVTLMLNTDGIALSHSSKTSLYPLQYVICELPPEIRKYFLIVCGVWCSDEKPIMNIFLKPYLDELQHIFREGGVKWTHPDTKEQMISPVTAPLVCADAPIRASIQNIKSHNAKYGCNSCEQKMKTIPLTNEEKVLKAQNKKIKRKRAFIFEEQQARLRSKHRMVKQAIKAHKKNLKLANKINVKGVKGPAGISVCPCVDVSTCVYGEYMHLVCLGVVRLFLNLWFFVPGPWNISEHIEEVDLFMKNIRPPSFIGRLPRGVSDLKNWKASEFRAWLSYYSLPAVCNFLPDCFFQHWMLLVMAIYLLLQDNISPQHLKQAEIMIRLFVRDVGKLYGDKYYVYNMHELVHLPLYVERWGPLWATSAFQFEDYNGVISRLIHGTKNKGKELINNLRLAHSVSILRHKVKKQNDCNVAPHKTPTNQLQSRCSLTQISKLDMAALKAHDITEPFDLYYRLKVEREVFTSKLYQREKKRNNYTVEYQDEATGLSCFGEIRCFVEKNNEIYALIAVLKVNHTGILLHDASCSNVSHLIPVEPSNDFAVISSSSFTKTVSKVIPVGDFVCRCPNVFEKNL